MKKLIITVFCTFLIVGCGKKEDSKSEQSDPVKFENKDTPAANITKDNGTAKNLSKTSSGIEIHKFDKNNLPSSIKYQGNIVDGAYWTDKNGDNILVITQTEIKQISEDIREQYLYGYQYVNHEDGYVQMWNITDYVKSYCDVDAKYYPGTLEIKDVDGDEIAESVFCYELEGRCDVSPLDVKLMMHSGDKKLVIRGTIGFDPQTGRKTKGEKNFDAAFKDVPSSFKDYASQKWDEFVEKYKKE